MVNRKYAYKIDGKTLYHHSLHLTKKNAKSEAKKMRIKGYPNVRIRDLGDSHQVLVGRKKY